MIWNPGFEFKRSQTVAVADYTRRLWQGSTDHRGTPELPGLVATLVPAPGEQCWGVAFEVTDEDWPRLRQQLDHREKDGYTLERVHCSGGQEAWTYVADEANPQFIGPRPEREMLDRLARAAGESGPNQVYLFRLEETLRALDIEDPHVFGLAAALRGWLAG